jgi:hypothetical protein
MKKFAIFKSQGINKEVTYRFREIPQDSVFVVRGQASIIIQAVEPTQEEMAAKFESLRPVPLEIPNWRAKAILATMGLTAQVDAILASLPEPQRTVVTAAWQGDAKLARQGSTVLALAQALGMSAEQIDTLFIAAEAIEI